MHAIQLVVSIVFSECAHAQEGNNALDHANEHGHQDIVDLLTPK
jgi:hypothetical protein